MTRAEDLPDVASGKEFYNSYDPKEILGRGVSSTVRRCVHKATQIEYAVKIIDIIGNESILTEDLRAVTHNEIELLREVSGKSNIIELVDVFENDTFIFLVFELLRNGELFDYLTKIVKFNEKQTRHTMRTLLESIEYLHSINIVHRDLKPENILLDEECELRLTDFGFAVKLNEDDYLRELCGTPGYMSPEMLKCALNESHPGYNKAIDMWACGVILYTLLAGVAPFWHRKQMIMLRRIMEGSYTFPSPDWDDISEPAKDLISRLLVVDPKTRLTAAQALQHPFFQQVDGESRYSEVPFNARRKFRVAVHTVIAASRITSIYHKHRPLKVEHASRNPYAVKAIRRMIDASAFGVYGHWVKKATNQNRAVLFENSTRTEQHYLAELEKFSNEQEPKEIFFTFNNNNSSIASKA